MEMIDKRKGQKMNESLKKVSTVLLGIIMVISIVINILPEYVKADTVLTSPLITVEGYQIKTKVTEGQGITFRTICKAPDIGSMITVNGKKYTVTNLGTIYSKDPNTTGDNTKNILDKSYTELNPIPYFEKERNLEFKYIGQKDYNGTFLTFGYIATDDGILEQKDGITSYVRTIKNINNFITNTIRARAFVEAVDEDGKDVIIYGQYASLMSVAEIAYKLYLKSGAPDEMSHKYLYTNILHKLPTSNPYYMDVEIEYGWSGIVS